MTAHQIWFIRHGQSEGNAGLPTANPRETALTSLGKAQAQCIASCIQTRPTRLVISPYIRTRQTAAPSIEKFPGLVPETWPIQEFTYLSLPDDRATSREERRPLVTAYWQRCDPFYVDGDGAESFSQLMARVELTLKTLRQQTGFVLVFGHGMFMKALLWFVLDNPTTINSEAMQRFDRFSGAIAIPNASILKLQFPDAAEIRLSNLLTDHIPDHLKT